MDKIIYKAFTQQASGIVNCLRSQVYIENDGKSIPTSAVWDTGAMGTCISEEVAKQLKLIPTGYATINTPAGSKVVNKYLVNIILPNKVKVIDVPVCDSKIGSQGIGVLIGMDIITFGDFCISNYNNKTTLSYRMPSKKVTDYVVESNIDNMVGTHGKGKRKNS